VIPAWPEGYALKQHGVIDSTNEEAHRLAAAGEPGPVWIAADRQTTGRGRRGSAWQSSAGNLAATLFLRPGKPAGECAQLSFVAAIATHDAISTFVPDANICVKWPNDVLANGKKIAGILLESASNGTTPDWLAIGIGINLAYFPEGTETPATSLAELGANAPPPREALARLAASFAKCYDLWRARGFQPVRDAWLARAGGLGMRIRARLANGEFWGVFEGIDETGALILREAQGRARIIAAGEVFFG
jgi:BirA family biotin operon repressor/biotin-[acetyl-CoA-carboxylase] ligase